MIVLDEHCSFHTYTPPSSNTVPSIFEINKNSLTNKKQFLETQNSLFWELAFVSSNNLSKMFGWSRLKIKVPYNLIMSQLLKLFEKDTGEAENPRTGQHHSFLQLYTLLVVPTPLFLIQGNNPAEGNGADG